MFQQSVIYLRLNLVGAQRAHSNRLPGTTLPSNKLLGATKAGRKAFVVRQIIQHRENGILALNVELRIELTLWKKEPIDASHAKA